MWWGAQFTPPGAPGRPSARVKLTESLVLVCSDPEGAGEVGGHPLQGLGSEGAGVREGPQGGQRAVQLQDGPAEAPARAEAGGMASHCPRQDATCA